MDRFVTTLTDRWWLVALRGVLAIVFGVTAWVWPGLTAAALVFLFGVYALVGGAISLGAAFVSREEGASPWPFVFDGLLGIGAGVTVMVWPDISALALLYVIAAWAFVSGVFAVAGAIEMRKEIDNEWRLGLAGVASIAFGLLTAVFPGDGAVALVWAIGVQAVAVGFLLISLGFRLHGRGRQLAPAAA